MILRGLWLLGTGRKAGLAEFSDSTDGLTASLAPLIAFPMVGAGITALQGRPELAILAFLARLCAVLALPLLTYEFARLTGRLPLWLRTATALNWSFWILIPLVFIAAAAGALLVATGIDEATAGYAALAMMLACLTWFHWFTVRNGLQISAIRATGLVALNISVIGLLTAGPAIIGYVLHVMVA